ncbi:glycosyltransferase family 2 protein [Alphaproteobacteria bacterium]|nr:glycosyltransferase family 2 protein [Alphaproteobacteria bacterium]|tara:strand:- start:3882 stop:4769 length:888 start_codon:yes stop_codon:yes gene_type:complete
MYKNKKIEISIILPSFNTGSLIGRAVKSVLNQTYKFWELIIVDNFSVDETDKVLKSFNDRRIKVFKFKNNGIIAASRNLGIRKSNGKYIAFLDSDDWWTRQKLEISLLHFNKGFDLVYHDLFLDKQSKLKFLKRKVGSSKLEEDVYNDLIQNGNKIPNSSVVIKYNVLKKVDFLSESRDKIGWEDFDCWLRLAKIKIKFGFINQTLGFYWLGSNNTSNPEMNIKNLNAFQYYYLLPQNLTMPNWVKYSYCSSYYKLKDYKLAKKFIITKNFSGTKINILLKNFYLFIHLKIKCFL